MLPDDDEDFAIVRERVSSVKVLWSNVWKDESLPRLDSSEFRVKFDGLLSEKKWPKISRKSVIKLINRAFMRPFSAPFFGRTSRYGTGL